MPDLGRWNGMDQLSEDYHSTSPYAYVKNNPLSFIDPDGRLSEGFMNEMRNSPSGTVWTNNGNGFTNNWGGMMDYSGSPTNYLGYSSMASGGDGGGGAVAGETLLPHLSMTVPKSYQGNMALTMISFSMGFQQHLATYLGHWQQGFDPMTWVRNDGPIQYVGGAGDPLGIWQVGGMVLAANSNGNANYILAALLITRSGNTGGLKVLNAELGAAKTLNYKSTFFSANPELKGNVVVHHAVEQQVLKRYPGVITAEEMHSLENLRGIPKSINSDVHLSQIRKIWNRFYKQNPNPSKEQLLNQATIIDQKFGSQFLPPLK